MVSFIKNLKTKEDKSFESDTLSNCDYLFGFGGFSGIERVRSVFNPVPVSLLVKQYDLTAFF